MWEYRHTDELYHYGRKGMKWGQHIFGKVKKAVKTFRKEREAVKAIKKAEAEEAKRKARERAKPASELSDAELRARTNRLQMEKNYIDLQRQIDQLTPQKVNKGKELFNKVMNEAVTPKLIEAGKKMLGNILDSQVEKLTGVKKVSDTVGEAYEQARKELGKMVTEEDTRRLQGYISRGSITRSEIDDEVGRMEKRKKLLG